MINYREIHELYDRASNDVALKDRITSLLNECSVHRREAREFEWNITHKYKDIFDEIDKSNELRLKRKLEKSLFYRVINKLSPSSA